jgi:hypothetical protein
LSLLQTSVAYEGSMEEMIVYAPLRTEATDEGAETAEQNQTKFLLGLKDDSGGTEESSDTDLELERVASFILK